MHIDRYAYAFIAPRQDGGLAFRAKDLGREETFQSPESATSSKLDLHRGVYLRMVQEFNRGRHIPMTLTTSVDAPQGSGLGSSSALVVAMIDAFRVLLELPLGQYEVAKLAFEIEREDLKLSGGKQDQYAATFGGINFIEFLANRRVIVNPLRVPVWVRNELESSLVVAFSGQSRSSAAIIDQQKAALAGNSATALEAMHQLKSDAIEMKRVLLQGMIGEVAAILDRYRAGLRDIFIRSIRVYTPCSSGMAWRPATLPSTGGITTTHYFLTAPTRPLPLADPSR